ncbi:MAG: DUF2062 domain-containing protein [Planctomycetota bacterium]
MPRAFIYRRFIRRILLINDTPEAIALGTAIGIFIAMTPTVGIQMFLMVIAGTLVRANRLAGIIMVYISNPFTLVPIYWLDYLVGSTVLGEQAVTRERFEEIFRTALDQMKGLDFWIALRTWVQALSGELALPMMVGGMLLGLLIAIPFYPLTLRGVRLHQRYRARRQALLQLREIRRGERERKRTRVQEDVAERKVIE